MPPKTKFKKQDIFDIAFEYVRNNGWNGLSSRYIAEQLNSSTMPIYSCFKSMGHLEEEIIKRAMEIFFDYISAPRTGDKWIDHGVGYVMFALQEKYLFRAVFDESYVSLRKKYSEFIWRNLGMELSSYPPFQELSENQILHLRRGRWVTVHGLASLANTGALPIEDIKEIPDIVRNASNVLLSGVKANFE